MATITFTPTTWVDDTTPAITAAQLNRIEAAIDDVINAGGDLDLGSNDLITGGEIKTGDGTAAAPSLAFENYTNKGFYSSGAGLVSLSIAGSEVFEMSATYLTGAATSSAYITSGAGTVSLPAFAFRGDTDTGMYRVGTNIVGLAGGGTLGLQVGGSAVKSTMIRDSTTANAANTYIATTDGQIYRSTSALKYKTNVETLTGVPRLRGVTYTSTLDDTRRIGLIADEVADVLPEAAVYNEDGDIEDYDTKAVLGYLVARVNDLEARL